MGYFANDVLNLMSVSRCDISFPYSLINQMVPEYNQFVKASLKEYGTYFVDQPGGDNERWAT